MLHLDSVCCFRAPYVLYVLGRPISNALVAFRVPDEDKKLPVDDRSMTKFPVLLSRFDTFSYQVFDSNFCNTSMYYEIYFSTKLVEAPRYSRHDRIRYSSVSFCVNFPKLCYSFK